jgi:hypothetical protein
MSRQHFSIIAVLAAVVIALVALLVPQRGGFDPGESGQALLPGLMDRVNDIDRVVISGHAGTKATLSKGDGQWRVEELDGYPADWSRLQALLSDLAQMEIVEAKTANPEYYPRLGVEDVTAEGASGTRIDFSAADSAWSVIAGHEASLQYGQYLRIADQPQSVLVDRILDLSPEAVDWADAEILDVGSGLVAEVSILHPDGERVRISKVSADDANFTLKTLPEGREPQSERKVDALASAYAGLRMEDVQADPGAGGQTPVDIKVVLFSGERFQVQVFEQDAARWLRVIHESGPNPAAPEADSEAAPETAAKVADPQRLEGWVFKVADSRLETMAPRLESLLKPLESGSGEQD